MMKRGKHEFVDTLNCRYVNSDHGNLQASSEAIVLQVSFRSTQAQLHP